MTYIEEGMSNKTFIIMMVVAFLLIGGAIHSTYLENKHEAEAEAKAFQERGCIIYGDVHGIDNVPVKCNNDFVEHEERR